MLLFYCARPPCVLVSQLLAAWRGALVTRQIFVANYGKPMVLVRADEAASKKIVPARNIFLVALQTPLEISEERDGKEKRC